MNADILHTPATDIVKTSAYGRLLAGLNLRNAEEVHGSSVTRMEDFWSYAVDDLGVRFSHRGKKVIDEPHVMKGGQFFKDSTLNFAENLLKKNGEADCLVYRCEDAIHARMSWDEVRGQVSRLQQCLADVGVGKGDVVAGFVPNCPEAVIAMLATTSLGAVWTSCSPDFGVDGVLDRFGQTKPIVLFSAEGYYYHGKRYESLPKIASLVEGLDSLRSVVVFENGGEGAGLSQIRGAVSWQEALRSYKPREVHYTPVAFNDPLFIMYSSGTTGKPKCIVHGAGGTLLSVLVEGKYHSKLGEDSRVFFYSTCGWMMWNWLVGQMACGATILLFDGSPFSPSATALFDFMQDERATFMGVSAKYIEVAMKRNMQPCVSHDLSHLQTLGSTGSVLPAQAFEWIHESVKRNVYISSLSGGTDILGCFLMGNPLTPVHKGELVGPVLGKAVEVWGDDGVKLERGTGELMCVKPFPSMPIYFWNDARGEKYRAAYFEKFAGLWCHGDFVEKTETGFIIHGRSDAVLNPGGVRIGTAEIYAQLAHFSDVEESVVIGQPWNNDVRVVLFVKMQPGKKLNNALVVELEARIKTHCSPHHVPAKIVQVADIPRTRSGKVSEIAVRDVVMGRSIKNASALANPEALDAFKQLPSLQN